MSRTDADLFRNSMPPELGTWQLIRDQQHTTAAIRAENEVRDMAKRDPWASSEEGRRFLEKVYSVLDRLQTLPEGMV